MSKVVCILRGGGSWKCKDGRTSGMMRIMRNRRKSLYGKKTYCFRILNQRKCCKEIPEEHCCAYSKEVGRNVVLLHVCEGKKLCWQGSWKKFLRFKKEISVCICCSKLVIM